MKNKGLLLLVSIGLLWLSKQSKSSKGIGGGNSSQDDGTTTPPFDPNETEAIRQVSAEQILSGAIPIEGNLHASSDEIEYLKSICDSTRAMFSWFISYIGDKSNLLESTTQAQKDYVISIIQTALDCLDEMCNAIDELSPSKPLSPDLIIAINNSAGCIENIENSLDDNLVAIAKTPQSIPNFF